jgi:HK97 family phage portal protein
MASIRDIVRSFITSPESTKEAPQVVLSQTNAYSYSRKDNYESYADEGYRKNAIVYRCVNEIANGASAIPFKAFQGDQELDSHPILSLLKRPNPQQAGVEYFQGLYSSLLLSGNSYAIRNDLGVTPNELYLLRPDRIRIKPSKTSVPSSYEYVLGGKLVQSYPVDASTGESEVKHLKMWNPLDDYYGLSPIMAAAVDIDNHNEINKHNISLLRNGARPTGAIVFRPSDDRGMSIQLTDGQRQQLNDDLRQRFQGSDNAGRPLLLEGDFDWKEMGLSPKDMDYLNQKHIAAKDIALCFGVPSQLIGIPDSQTYANVQEARLALYEETIIPLAKRVESDFNEWLAPAFGDDIRIQYDYDSIPAMTERRRRIYENVVAAVREGIISRNEARERLGLEPISGGDDVYIAANLFPLGSAEVAPAEGEDAEEDGKQAYDWDIVSKSEVEKDVFTTEAEATERAEEIGCTGIHSHDTDGGTVYMPCASHADYTRLTGDELQTPKKVFISDEEDEGDDSKAESDVDTTPTDSMAQEAERGLAWRKEFNRGGTEVGVARAVQLVSKERLSPRTVRRMHSFFSRHEVDKRATGFRRGEDGYPSAGRIAWALWGGDGGQTWARRKAAQLDKERDQKQEAVHEMQGLAALSLDENYWLNLDQKAPLSEAVKKGLANKVKEHNDKHGDKKGKRVTLRMLSAVFRRGVGAYNTNPSSVRPSVSSSDQWAYARVNVFLAAVRTGRFKRAKFDTDLLPKGHPLRTGD